MLWRRRGSRRRCAFLVGRGAGLLVGGRAQGHPRRGAHLADHAADAGKQPTRSCWSGGAHHDVARAGAPASQRPDRNKTYSRVQTHIRSIYWRY